jgi:GNAT superfamily N-acetyltransferase
VLYVRRASALDAGDLRTIRSEALQSEPDAYSSQYPRDVYSIRKYESMLSSGCYFLAYDDQQVVGMASMAPFDFRGTRHAGLYGMFVSTAYRGTGVASALVAEVRDVAREHRYRALYLSVNEALPRAVGFYEKEGFVLTDERYAMPRDETISLVTMYQPLELTP